MRTSKRCVRGIAIGVLAIAALTGCRGDWHTWGNGVERHGNNRWDHGLNPSTVNTLQHRWAADLGGWVNAAPIIAIDIPINGVKTDVAYVGTERGDFFALNAKTGAILWSRDLGSHIANCPDTPDNEYGVQGTATFDRPLNRVYALGGAGFAYALNPSTGANIAGWPVQITTDPVHNSVYGATNLWDNRLYMVTGSHCDQRPYHGSVVSVDVNTRAIKKYFTAGSETAPDGGGIWGWGGVSIDPTTGHIYGATGNIFTQPESGNSIIRLTSDLQLVAEHAPGNFIGDDDFGSTPTLFQKPGCPPQLVAEQKNGSLYLYDRNSIAGGFRQKLVLAAGEDFNHDPTPVNEFIGVPAYSPQTQMIYVSNPTGTADGVFTYGMNAFRLNSNCMLELAWQTPAGVKSYITSAPTVADGVVYYATGANRRVHAFNALTGAPLWNSGDVGAAMFTQPVVVNGQVFVGAYDNKLHMWSLPNN